MTLKNLLKISGDTPSTYGVLLNKSHAFAINGHVAAKVSHGLDLPLADEECVVLDAVQIRQIEAVKQFHVTRDGRSLVLSGLPVPIQKRSEVSFISEDKWKSIEPKPFKRPFTIALDPHLLSDLQRALSAERRHKHVVVTFDLEQADSGPWRVSVGEHGEGLFMPVRLDRASQEQNEESIAKR